MAHYFLQQEAVSEKRLGEHSTHVVTLVSYSAAASAVVLVRRVLNVKVGDTTGCVLFVHSILHLSKNING